MPRKNSEPAVPVSTLPTPPAGKVWQEVMSVVARPAPEPEPAPVLELPAE